MSVSSSVCSRSAVVARLRSAGCVFAEDEAGLLISAAATPAALATMIDRRVSGVPLEHILGWVDFADLQLAVDPGVFVPRRRTEFLVSQAAALARPGDVVVDLCCGCGAVGAAIATRVPIDLYAVDIDPAAVRCARRNLPGAHVLHGDLYRPLPPPLRDHVGIVVANAPYVPTDAIGLLPPEARDHEPHTALDGGIDGLDLHRRVAAEAPRWLAPGGHLLIETSTRQSTATLTTFLDAGLDAHITDDDDLGATVVIGTKPA